MDLGEEEVDSRSHPVEVARSCFEVCKRVSKEIREGRALNPTGSSLAGVGTAVVDLRILPDIRSLGSLPYLADDVVVKKEERALWELLVVG